jgi:hypothetical protein
MSDKKPAPVASKWTDDERLTLITLPWIAGAAVSECDKAGGARETAKESDALNSAVSASFLGFQVKTGENLSGEPRTFDFEQADSLLAKAAEDAIALIEKESTEKQDLYKKVVLEVAYQVAMAYGAGWRGRGQKVSDKEKAMVKKIAELAKASHLLEAVIKDAEEHAPQAKFGR